MSPTSPQEATQLSDGGVKAPVAVEPVPGWASAAAAPLADGALRRTDEGAELLEQDDAVVVPLLGDADRGDDHGPTPFVNRPQGCDHVWKSNGDRGTSDTCWRTFSVTQVTEKCGCDHACANLSAPHTQSCGRRSLQMQFLRPHARRVEVGSLQRIRTARSLRAQRSTSSAARDAARAGPRSPRSRLKDPIHWRRVSSTDSATRCAMLSCRPRVMPTYADAAPVVSPTTSQGEDPFRSKFTYVKSRLQERRLPELLDIARAVLAEWDDDDLRATRRGLRRLPVRDPADRPPRLACLDRSRDDRRPARTHRDPQRTRRARGRPVRRALGGLLRARAGVPGRAGGPLSGQRAGDRRHGRRRSHEDHQGRLLGPRQPDPQGHDLRRRRSDQVRDPRHGRLAPRHLGRAEQVIDGRATYPRRRRLEAARSASTVPSAEGSLAADRMPPLPPPPAAAAAASETLTPTTATPVTLDGTR